MEKVDSPRCMMCNLYEETLEHMFFKCLEICSLWLYVEGICNQHSAPALSSLTLVLYVVRDFDVLLK